MSKTITVVPGDGIGPEVTRSVLKVLDEVGCDFEYDMQLGGIAALEATGSPLPDATLASFQRTGVALKGPLTTPVGEGFRSINVQIRKHFDLYANVRPALTLVPGGRYEDVDIVVVRENTEGLYIGVEHWIPVAGDPKAAAESLMIITRHGSERIVRFAFEYAVAHNRQRVTLVHKANILKYTQGLFLDVGREIAAEYEGRVAFDDRIVDAAAMSLVLDPSNSDVLVMENMFGDILSDLTAGLIGGLGLAPAANLGTTHAMFEAVHGSAADIAGKGIANPTALLLAACMMLDHLEMSEEARRIRNVVQVLVADKSVRTRDLGGSATTQEFTDALLGALV